MPVVFLITIAAVLVGIFFAATGRGGELAHEQADHAPLDLGPVSAADIALLRPPTALWGYSMQVTDEALDTIARAMRERDVTIAYLQEQLTSHERHGSYAEPQGAHARQGLDAPLAPGFTPFPEMTGTTEVPEASEVAEPPLVPEASEVAEPPLVPEASEVAEPPLVPEASEASVTAEALESPEAPQPAEAPETLEPPEHPDPLESSNSPEPPVAAEPPAAAPPPKAPQTTLVLKASGPKPPPAPEPEEPTQPSQTRQDGEEAHEATQPSATLPPDETQGPQGAFNAHGWWAEQEEAAREEQARHPAAGDQQAPEDKEAGDQEAPEDKEAFSGPHDDSVAAAEEQGW